MNDNVLPQAGIGQNRKWEVFVDDIDQLQIGRVVRSSTRQLRILRIFYRVMWWVSVFREHGQCNEAFGKTRIESRLIEDLDGMGFTRHLPS